MDICRTRAMVYLPVSNIEAIELSIVADIVCSGKGLEVQCGARISD